jgi:hypothetical protein
MEKINNSTARSYVNAKVNFQGSHMYGMWQGRYFVVFSYGHHFPMYAYDSKRGEWLGNEDKYSPTTSRHQRDTMPTEGVHKWMGTEALKNTLGIL